MGRRDDAHVDRDRLRARRRAGRPRSSSTRSSLGCSSSGSSPISSRNSVPPSASSNGPRRMRVAPVNAPRSWPNSSLSNTLAAIAPQSTCMNGRSARGDAAWSVRATQALAGAALAEQQHARIAASRRARSSCAARGSPSIRRRASRLRSRPRRACAGTGSRPRACRAARGSRRSAPRACATASVILPNARAFASATASWPASAPSRSRSSRRVEVAALARAEHEPRRLARRCARRRPDRDAVVRARLGVVGDRRRRRRACAIVQPVAVLAGTARRPPRAPRRRSARPPRARGRRARATARGSRSTCRSASM